jgi:hypothetical protein
VCLRKDSTETVHKKVGSISRTLLHVIMTMTVIPYESFVASCMRYETTTMLNELRKVIIFTDVALRSLASKVLRNIDICK